MLISENKLYFLGISGLTYLIILGLTNTKINIFYLISNNLLSMFIIFIIMYLIGIISHNLYGKKSLGMGDIKLASISTIWLGNELSFISLYISFFISAIYSLQGRFNKKLKPLQQYPFSPFLSIGIFCSWIIDKI
tara:strand:- start:375 stop:779 length:405 start_codon:yes stop_codon:yes gene_type:complete